MGDLYGANGFWSSSTTTTVTGEATSSAVYSESPNATAYIALYDRASGAMAWGGELRVSGQGDIAVTDREFIRAATNKIAGELRVGGLLK